MAYKYKRRLILEVRRNFQASISYAWNPIIVIIVTVYALALYHSGTSAGTVVTELYLWHTWITEKQQNDSALVELIVLRGIDNKAIIQTHARNDQAAWTILAVPSAVHSYYINITGVNKWTDICRNHDDVIKWKHFPRIWPFVRGIHRSPVYSPYNGQWRGALVFSLICAWIKGLSKQSWGWRFETPSRSLWRHCFDSYKELMKSLTIFSRYSNGK